MVHAEVRYKCAPYGAVFEPVGGGSAREGGGERGGVFDAPRMLDTNDFFREV